MRAHNARNLLDDCGRYCLSQRQRLDCFSEFITDLQGYGTPHFLTLLVAHLSCAYTYVRNELLIMRVRLCCVHLCGVACAVVSLQLFDLLNPQRTNLQLREDPQMGVFVEGLEEKHTEDIGGALSVINKALENRVMASTLMVSYVFL